MSEDIEAFEEWLGECHDDVLRDAAWTGWQGGCASQASHMKELEAENARLREALSNYVNVVQSFHDPNSFDVKVIDAGKPARDALNQKGGE